VLANITSESSHCFQKGNRNTGHRLCIMLCPSFWAGYYMLIYTHCWELMNAVGNHGSSSLQFMMKVTVCHFVSNSHEVMTALIIMLPLMVVVENCCCGDFSATSSSLFHWLLYSNRCRCLHDGTIRRYYIAYLENTVYTSIIPAKE
jgi:hypothetical protein